MDNINVFSDALPMLDYYKRLHDENKKDASAKAVNHCCEHDLQFPEWTRTWIGKQAEDYLKKSKITKPQRVYAVRAAAMHAAEYHLNYGHYACPDGPYTDGFDGGPTKAADLARNLLQKDSMYTMLKGRGIAVKEIDLYAWWYRDNKKEIYKEPDPELFELFLKELM